MDNITLLKISSFLLGLVGGGFFIYSNVKLSDFHNDYGDECEDYQEYTFYLLLVFILSVVGLIFLCCATLINIIFYIFNSFTIVSVAIGRYYYNNQVCDSQCKVECPELVELNEKIDVFFIIDIVIVGVTIIMIVLNIICKFL